MAKRCVISSTGPKSFQSPGPTCRRLFDLAASAHSTHSACLTLSACQDEGCHRARSPQRRRGSGLRVRAGAALRCSRAPRRAVRGMLARSRIARSVAILPLRETRARARPLGQVSRLSPLRMSDDSTPTSGRRGISVDQDGKSNIWSIEPTMKVRPFPSAIMPLSPRPPRLSAPRLIRTGRGGEQR